MGRGLSELQQDIILMAYKNKEAGLVSYQTSDERYTFSVVSAHVKREQILRERFGWEPADRFWMRRFSRKDIGEERYNRVMASLSRSLHRLEQRGLVELTHSMRAGAWSGAELTEEGEAEAGRILERREGRSRGPTRIP
jgi:hypothetical protein